MFVKILNFLRGYISVKSSGGFNERLINLCNANDIPIWSVSFIGDDVFFLTKASRYRKLKKLAEKSGSSVKVNGRFGLPFLISKNKESLVLLCGVIFVLIFIGIMNTRIWSISVVGNKEIFDSEIIGEFERLGVRVGARKKSIDVIKTQNEFLSSFKNRVIWVSLNMEGMCAEIQIREFVKGEEASDEQPCNIVAAFDGTLRSMRVYSGTQIESVKSGVRKGDLLISGVVEYHDGTHDFVQARGDVAAEHIVNITTKLSSNSVRKYSLLREYSTLSLFNFCLPLGKCENNKTGEVTSNKSVATLNSVTLPFSLTRYTQSFYETGEANENLRRRYLIKIYLNEVSKATMNAEVLSVTSCFVNKGVNLNLEGKIKCIDYIGENAPIVIKNE